MHTPSDAHIHLVDRHGTLPWTPEKSAKLSNMSCKRFDHDRAILLNNKTKAITGINAEMFAHFLRNGDLALCCQRCCRHGITPYIMYLTLPYCKEQDLGRIERRSPAEYSVRVVALQLRAET